MAERRIERDEVLRIANLARLSVEEGELERFSVELSRIVVFVSQLEELDTRAVGTTVHAELTRLPLRADEPAPSLARELVMGEAPSSEDGSFQVPSFVDEG